MGSDSFLAFVWASVSGLALAVLLTTRTQGPILYLRNKVLGRGARVEGDDSLFSYFVFCTACQSFWWGTLAGIGCMLLGTDDVRLLTAGLCSHLLVKVLQKFGRNVR